jgi:PiT family inorganic phosphate transporter
LSGDVLLVTVVLIALAFDFTNGFHDTANAVATSVSTRALSPRIAVLIAAVMNFVGALTSTAVAKTISQGILTEGAGTQKVVLAALLGAIVWNLVTWWFGLPSSSSHALIGGLIGGGVAAAGWSAVQWHGLVDKVIQPGIVSPLLGFGLAFVLMIAVLWIFARARPGPLNRGFRLAQIFSGSFMAYTHGANDAQKTMGVITLALVANGNLSTPDVPTWVVLTAGTAIALGTYVGGWRIMRTIGNRVFKLEPPHGFAAQTSSSGILFATAHLGYPVSTTHVISASVMGVGATKRLSAVRWGVAGNIVLAWIFTIPAAALTASAAYEMLRLL